ncbi:MAG: aldehyde dehydrogenase family protein [Congregibacter sp.]
MTQQYQVINPYSLEVNGEYAYDSLSDVEAALHELKQGQGTQRKLTAHERADILRRLAGLLEEHAEELARLICSETGKTISDARVEISRAFNTTIASSEEARQIHGEALDSDAYPPARVRIGVECWRPLGTVMCITPFNFPLNIAMHKLGPAFAAGNAILFKPHPVNTVSATRLVDLCYEAGIPRSVLQLSMPRVEDMPSIIANPEVAMINFTGGEAAANAIASAAGYKKLLLELGGNDPLILMPDGDVEAAVNASMNQRFATAGQRCTATKRVYVHAAVYDSYRELLLTQTGKLVTGDPAKEDTFVGPVIDSRAADEIEKRIQQAVEHGAHLAAGGARVGNVIEPTVLEDVPDDCDLVSKETFGPVLPLRRFTDISEVIALVNASPFGLQAGVFTKDIELARQLFDELEVGTLAINDGPGFRAEHFPFGGVKESGIGREGIRYAIREMSYQKTLVI